MSPRAHDYDLNDGDIADIIGNVLLTKFGHDYDPATDLFATLIRIRNRNCEGFGVCDYRTFPFNTTTQTVMNLGVGSTLIPDVGHIHVYDRSSFSFVTGTIRSQLFEVSNEASITVRYKLGSTPTIDGVAVAEGIQTLVPDRSHALVFEDSVTDETRSMTVMTHNPLTLFTLSEAPS